MLLMGSGSPPCGHHVDKDKAHQQQHQEESVALGR